MVVRFTWTVTEGHHHPRHTYACVQDVETAKVAARHAEALSKTGVTLQGAEVSATPGKAGPWEPIAIDAEAEEDQA